MEIGSRVCSHVLAQTSLQRDVPLAPGTSALGGRVSAHTGIHHVPVFVMRANKTLDPVDGSEKEW